ncbi:MAG: hypothetical protein RR832_05790 [Bacilli bacterium]
MREESLKLYEELVKSDKHYVITDLSVINEVTMFLESSDIILSEKNFNKLCNEVLRQHLKYEDVILNYDTVEKIINEMGL